MKKTRLEDLVDPISAREIEMSEARLIVASLSKHLTAQEMQLLQTETKEDLLALDIPIKSYRARQAAKRKARAKARAFLGMNYAHERKAHRDARPQVDAVMPTRNGAYATHMREYLVERGLSYLLAEYNGWYTSTDAGDNHPRIVMPASNTGGFIYWQARSIYSGDLPRYQSPRVPRHDSVIVVYASNNWELSEYIYIVEGPMDALAIAGEGYTAIALMGSMPKHEALVSIVTRFPDKRLVIFADTDAFGAGARLLAEFSMLGRTVLLMNATPYKDIASVPVDLRREYLL